MKINCCTKQSFIIVTLIFYSIFSNAQKIVEPAFKWGNGSYYDLNIGDTIKFGGLNIVMIGMNNHYNKFTVGADTVELKVSRRSLPVSSNSVRFFVADNRNVRKLAANKNVHGLMKKDALICLSETKNHLLPLNKFRFPVSYNDGFKWNMNEDNHMFSYLNKGYNANGEEAISNEGIGIALNDARGIEKHWLVAIEDSKVIWIEDEETGSSYEACVMLQSSSNPFIFYVYDHLYKNNIEVRKGQQLRVGELIGTCWGDKNWAYTQIAVIKSDTIPDYTNRFSNCVNFFPQLYELYFKSTFGFSKSFTRGKINFGWPSSFNGNQKNLLAFEEYTGKGWDLGAWNTADKVMHCTEGAFGNARLKKVLFENTNAECRNPNNYYDFEINVRNGVYRVRAQVGNVQSASWQKVEFEGVVTSHYSLGPGEMKWTSEKVVRVNDRRLTVRIYIDPENKKEAGVSEIVFQQAY